MITALAFVYLVFTYVAQPQPEVASFSASDLRIAYPVADFVRTHTRPGDKVFFPGSMAPGYWLADRHAPTRFFHIAPVDWQPSYPAERRRDLFAHPPTALAILPDAEERDRDGDPSRPALVPELLRRFAYRLRFDRDGARVWLLGSR